MTRSSVGERSRVRAPIELLRALAVLAEPPGEGSARLAELCGLPSQPDEETFTELFLFQLPPYASVYLGPEGMLGGEARARIAGFWRALGHTPPAEPDHLSALLGLYATLVEHERATEGATRALVRSGHEALLHEHLTTWVFGYLDRVREIDVVPYVAWAETLSDALVAELGRAATSEGTALHLRDAPELPDPRVGGGRDFLAGLLAPVRSGVILTRRSLARAARALGLGLRIGERRYVLEHLLGQEPAGVLWWLASEARRQGTEHSARRPTLGDVAVFWAARAEGTAGLLGELARDGADALASEAERAVP